MRKKTIVGLILLFVLVFSMSINAQENKEQTAQKIKLTKLYIEQKLRQAESDLTAFVIAGIAYAKSKGETSKDYAKFVGDLFGPSWKAGKGKGPAYLVKGLYHNFQQFEKFELEILSETETSIKAKMNMPWKDQVNSCQEMGVTLEEVNNFFGYGWSGIASHLGLEFKHKIEGDWIIFSVKIKE